MHARCHFGKQRLTFILSFFHIQYTWHWFQSLVQNSMECQKCLWPGQSILSRQTVLSICKNVGKQYYTSINTQMLLL
jgi:hypothetical protein